MQLKNKIFNYFVIPPKVKGDMPRVVLSPVTMNSNVAKQLIQRQLSKEDGERVTIHKLLHVCYDYDSQRVYAPNSHDFSKDNMEFLLQAAEVRITKDFGGFSSQPPIEGSPFSSLRVRSLNSFGHARNIISKHYNGKIFKDLPVIEASLSRMPTTMKNLPSQFRDNDEFLGGYIGTEHASSISFVDELDNNGRRRKEPIVLLHQNSPFILINISETSKREEPTATEKEWVVLNGYRDYLHDQKASGDEKYISDNINQFADLYAIKRYLYLGWSLEEVSSFMLKDANNLVQLAKGIDRIMQSVESLKSEGYKDVASVPYYMTFKIDETFPIKIDTLMDKSTGKIKTEMQYKNFIIIDYDKNNSYVLIESPVFVSPDVCIKVLKAKSTPFISKYNSIVNTIDIKSVGKSFEELRRDKIQLLKIKGIVKSGIDTDKKASVDFRGGDIASGISSVNPMVYNVRRISDYLYAYDYIKKMCDKNNIAFEDFDVVIGPIERLFGQGVQGGFMDAKSFEKSKLKIPCEITKGVWVSPPVIVINSITMPSYADQTETLIHEYRHYIYGMQNPNYEQQYGHAKKKKGEDYEFWYHYLNDPNERAAHKDEIKFELGLGKSYDEIIRNKVGGRITTGNYPIALKFSELVKEAMEELESEGKIKEQPNEILEEIQNEKFIAERK